MASQQPTKSPTLWASRPSTRTRLRQCLSCLDLLAHSWIKKEKRTDVNGPQSSSESSSVRQRFVQWHAVKSFHSPPTLQPAPQVCLRSRSCFHPALSGCPLCTYAKSLRVSSQQFIKQKNCQSLVHARSNAFGAGSLGSSEPNLGAICWER